jgi:uncharacterized peroxidase-related enzyme
MTMTTYAIHTTSSAPEKSRDTLRHVQATLGGVPNLAAAMAEAPSLLRAFFAVREIYSQGTLSAGDIQVLSIANAVENDCDWCVAFHTMMAQKSGVSEATIDALRVGEDPTDSRARALSVFTRALIQHRGAVPSSALEAFHAAGFTPAQVLEVILGIAFSVMANYAHHIVHAPLDEMLSAHAWTRPAVAKRIPVTPRR